MISEDNLKLAKFIDGALSDPTQKGQPYAVAGHVKEDVQSIRTSHNVNVTTNWDFYKGNQSKYFVQRHREPNEAFKERKKNAITPNYCKFIVDVGSKFLYGKPEGIRRQYSKDKKTETRLRELEGLNQIPRLMLQSKKNAGIFSEAILRFIAVDQRTNEQITSVSTQTAYPRAIQLDPRYAFPLCNAWGKLIAVVVEYNTKDYANNKELAITELVVSDSRWVWHDGILVSAMKNEWELDAEFVVLSNADTGEDDIQGIINLQTKLNESLTDAQHFYESHGWPQMVSKVDLSQVIKAPGYIWEIQSESEGKVLDEIDYLTWDGKMKEARQHSQDLESYVLKMSFTAKMVTGDLEALGQLRTGAGIIAAYGPSIQKAEERQVVWRQNEINLFTAMAKMDAKLHNASLFNRFPGLNVSITYSDEFVPGEELIRAEIAAMAMNSHTTTIRDEQRKKFPNATEEEIDAKRAEIVKDSEELTDSKRAFVTEEKGGEDKAATSSSEKKSKEQKE